MNGIPTNPTEQQNLWADVLLLKQDVGGLRDSIRGLREEIGGIKELITGYAKPKEPKYAIWISFISALSVAILFVANLLVANAARPLEDRATRQEALAAQWIPVINNLQSDMNSARAQVATATTERAEFGRHLFGIDDRVARIESKFESEHASRVSNEREIETQFDADNQLRNVQWATIYRNLNNFQNALSALGAKEPPSSDGPYFFPNISGRQTKQKNETEQ